MAVDVKGGPVELLLQQLADAEFGRTGRRSFFEYRDTGLSAATGGNYRAQVMRATDVMDTTGWHYHVADVQFVYILKGWVELQFAETGTVRLNAGDSINIPGNMPHNEIRASDELEILEISVPAKMGTVPCAVPANFKS